MDNQEAKVILSAYRPSGEDAQDPNMREALEQAHLDPELEKWLEEEKAFDEAISSKLKSVEVPAGLKETIMASERLRQETPKSQALFRQYRGAFALAAMLVLCLGLSVLFLNPISGSIEHSMCFNKYRDSMAELAPRRHALDAFPKSIDEARSFLSSNEAPSFAVLPTGLSQLQGFGCKVYDWNGQKVSLVCFRTQGDQVVHLFTINKDLFYNGPENEELRTKTMGNALNSVAWADDQNAYLLVAHAPGTNVSQFAPAY